MNKDEALRLALEALKTCHGWSGPDYWFDSEKVGKAIIAIRQALAQPEPEPAIYPDEAYELGLERIAYYTSPPKREPLTDEEILACWKQAYEPGRREHDNAARMARAIEAAHGIKGEA